MTRLEDALSTVTGRGVEVQGVVAVTGGAQRDTSFVDALVDDEARSWVLSVQRERIGGIPLADEVACIRAALDAGVVVPTIVAASTDASLLGGPFVVTERVPGEAIGRKVHRVVDGVGGLGERVVSELGTSLARLHGAAAAPPGLALFDGPRYLARLDAEASELVAPSATIGAGLSWLSDDPPAVTKPVLVHGDLRVGNVIVDATGLTGIVDWELAHRGDPMEDLAWASVRTWRYGRTPEVGGLAPLEVLVDAYEAAGGEFDEARFRWWRVARTVWWCIGLGRQCAAWMRGASDSLVHAASGRRLAEIEWDLLDLLEGEATRP